MRLLAAAALLLAAAPARAAPSEALLDCASLRVTPAFRDKLADAMLGDATAQNDALIEELANVAGACAAQHGLVDDPAEAYFAYAIARLPHDTLTVRLGDLAVPVRVVDDTLDFGPGRSNPVIAGSLSDAQIEALVTALETHGVDPAKVADSTWTMIGAYAATTSLMWQALRRLP